MRHLTKLGATCLVALVAAVPARAATCTQSEKDAAVAAVAAYQKKIPKERAAYFRTHKKPKLRKAFVKKQRTKLKRLREAAACDVLPSDTTPPKLLDANVNGATVTVTFDDDVSATGASFTVRVNGVQDAVASVASNGKIVVLSLAGAVGGDDAVSLDYAGGVEDAAGNAAAPAANVVVANATTAP